MIEKKSQPIESEGSGGGGARYFSKEAKKAGKQINKEIRKQRRGGRPCYIQTYSGSLV